MYIYTIIVNYIYMYVYIYIYIYMYTHKDLLAQDKGGPSKGGFLNNR